MALFRTLRADEIECRIGQIKSESGLSLLLYKDARVDQDLLDETVGEFNWKREHTRDNANCVVSIWDEKKSEWISKEDTGSESNTEAQKGLASDSFKRACVNWGIGRELYTAPFIWIKKDKCKIVANKNGKASCFDKFKVVSISYDENRNIDSLTIANESSNAIVYQFNCGDAKIETPKTTDDVPTDAQKRTLTSILARQGKGNVEIQEILSKIKTKRVMSASIEKALGIQAKDEIGEPTDEELAQF